ncbi:MAG: GNAT family N-acetyltransferase [Gemmatimonadota bacterium]
MPQSPNPHPLPPVRRLTSADAAAFQRLRLEGFERHPLQFRFAVEDEIDLTLESVGARLDREYVVGGFIGRKLVAIGGISRLTGLKHRHKALLWGMYVREEARGVGLGDAIVSRLLNQAVAEGVEAVVLTVAADNARGRALYERWGFTLYGVEPRALKHGDVYFDEALMNWHPPMAPSTDD